MLPQIAQKRRELKESGSARAWLTKGEYDVLQQLPAKTIQTQQVASKVYEVEEDVVEMCVASG